MGPKRVSLSPSAPTPPTWLDREAAAEWRRVVPPLESIGVLSKVDRGVLASYCTAWSHAVKARAVLEESGLVVEGPRDGPAKNPAWQIYRDATTLATSLAKELYMTPAARLRSTMPEAPHGDEGVLD